MQLCLFWLQKYGADTVQPHVSCRWIYAVRKNVPTLFHYDLICSLLVSESCKHVCGVRRLLKNSPYPAFPTQTCFSTTGCGHCVGEPCIQSKVNVHIHMYVVLTANTLDKCSITINQSFVSDNRALKGCYGYNKLVYG